MRTKSSSKSPKKENIIKELNKMAKKAGIKMPSLEVIALTMVMGDKDRELDKKIKRLSWLVAILALSTAFSLLSIVLNK